MVISGATSTPVLFTENSRVGVLYDPVQKVVSWFLNGNRVCGCRVAEKWESAYAFPTPAFGVFGSGVKISIDFSNKNRPEE